MTIQYVIVRCFANVGYVSSEVLLDSADWAIRASGKQRIRDCRSRYGMLVPFVPNADGIGGSWVADHTDREIARSLIKEADREGDGQ